MADNSVQIDEGTTTHIDTRTETTNNHHRQVVVLGDPTANAGVAPVDATNGLAVDAKTLAPGAASAANQASEIAVLNTIATNTGAPATDSQATGTISVLNGVVSIATEGAYNTTVLISGTWSASLIIEGLMGDLTTWQQVPFFELQSATPFQPGSTITANGSFLVPVGGFPQIRIRASAFTSGIVTVDLNASLGQQMSYSAQAGTWEVDVPGVSTSALQVAANATLTSLDTKTPALGQSTMAGSTPVVIASNQTAVPVSGTVSISGTSTVALDAGSLSALESITVQNGSGASAVNIQDGGNSITVDGSVSVSNFPATQAISAASLPLPTGAATETTLGTRLADSTFTGRINTLGQKTMANSTPVVIASDQAPVEVVALENTDTRLGVYFQASNTFTVTAAADAATGGKGWLINPVGSAVTVRVRQIQFSSQLGSALAAITSPRMRLERVTFTGTASGGTVAAAKRRTSDATQVSSWRIASTGLTLTAGPALMEFHPVAAATAVAYNAPAVYRVDLAPAAYIELAPGEGLVIRQADAGTAADTRRCTLSFILEEI